MSVRLDNSRIDWILCLFVTRLTFLCAVCFFLRQGFLSEFFSRMAEQQRHHRSSGKNFFLSLEISIFSYFVQNPGRRRPEMRTVLRKRYLFAHRNIGRSRSLCLLGKREDNPMIPECKYIYVRAVLKNVNIYMLGPYSRPRAQFFPIRTNLGR